MEEVHYTQVLKNKMNTQELKNITKQQTNNRLILYSRVGYYI